MLLSLRIQNYALIDALHVEFNGGLNIITGETGAGKSILLGALGLILGKRADTNVLSDSEKKCVIEAEFDIGNYNFKPYFLENDIDYDNHAIIRREILSSGKSRAFINDTPVTLNVLQEISFRLVDIHSQHQTLLLNKQSFILNIVDNFSGAANDLVKYQNEFHRYKQVLSLYHSRKEEYDKIKGEIDFISHQVDELSEAKLTPGELPQLESELYQHEHASELKMVFHEAGEILSAEESGVLDLMATIETRLSKIESAFPEAGELSGRIQSASIELKDIYETISALFEALDFDPKKHDEIKARHGLIHELLQKYRCRDTDQLIEVYKELDEKLRLVSDGEFELEKYKIEVDTHFSNVEKLAEQLHEKRKGCLKLLETSIVELLRNLGLEYSTIEFKVESTDYTISGKDNISMLFSANKNFKPQDISKIASGGELSRLMLSVKALMAGANNMPTLILDEIDSGVSGDIADRVGNIIQDMSNGIQIVNITHLPQVASKGKVHFKVYKDHSGENTKTRVKMLSNDERLTEIAKMLSGEQITEAALENARVLLDQ